MSESRRSGGVHIGAALQAALRETAVQHRVEAQQVILEWDAAVGPSMARAAKPLRIANGVLTLKARDAVWRTELLMRRTEIIRAINTHFHSELVTAIVVK